VSDRTGALDPRLRRLGSRIRQERENRGLSIEALAERADVGGRQLARVEAGRASPSVVWLWQLAAGLDLPLSQLVDDR
jgi:transcriptional regulator with XRE-family HTH domain